MTEPTQEQTNSSSRRSIVKAESDIKQLIEFETAGIDEIEADIKEQQMKLEARKERITGLRMALSAIGGGSSED